MALPGPAPAATSDGPGLAVARPRPRLVRFTPMSAIVVTAAVFVAFELRNAFVSAHQIVGWVVACSIVALLVDPVVNLVQRLLPRVLSVVLVVVALIAVVVGIVAGLTRELMRSIDVLQQAAPEAARGLEQRYDWAADIDVTSRVSDFVAQLDDAVRDEAIDRAVGTLPTYLVTGVLMLFLLGYGRRYVLGGLGLFRDLERRQLVRRIVFQGARRGRTYILWTLANVLANGLAFGVVCWLFDLPAPLSLGVAVALLTPIPMIGVLVGGVPALLLAFGLNSWRVGTAVLLVLIALQAIEVLVVRRIVDARSVRLGTTVAVVVALLAFDLYGLGAAAYAIALAVIALAALDVYGSERDEETEESEELAAASP
jgi:predicted PurR-regulated permease PerM